MKLLLFLKLVLLAQVNTLITFQDSGCILNIQYIGNSSAFSLTDCYYAGKGTFKTASSWDQCTDHCCDPDKVYSQVQQTLDVCQQDKKDADNRVLMIVLLSLFGGVILIIVVVCLICTLCCKNDIPQIENENQVNINQPQTNHIISNNLETQIESIQWKSSRSLQGDCPICLEPNCDLQIQNCNHQIHIQCWMQWYKGHKSCVTCRSTSVDKVNVYCSRCLLHCFQCRSEDLMRTSTTHKFTCSKCKIVQQNQ